MDRLALTKALGRWSGTVHPDEIDSTTAPTIEAGYVKDLVAYVDQAWLDIQLSKGSRWLWMRHRIDYTKALTASVRTLAMSAIDATCERVIPFLIHDTYPVLYILLKHPTNDTIHRCNFVPYSIFRGYYDRGDRPENRPTRYTVRPDGTLEFDPTPDVAYTVSLDWKHQPTEFSADGSTPDMPSKFHQLIVWWAIIHLMDIEEKGGRYQAADRQYARLNNRLCIEQLPPDDHGEFLSTAEVYGW
jgi:hypothetical protein